MQGSSRRVPLPHPPITSFSLCPHSHCTLQDSTGIFWDNDSLAALLSLELRADALILLSDVDGLFTGPPSSPESELISSFIKEVHHDAITFGAKSRIGRGGMTAKVDAAIKASMGGVTTVIGRYV